jgi:hypothetical protein
MESSGHLAAGESGKWVFHTIFELAEDSIKVKLDSKDNKDKVSLSKPTNASRQLNSDRKNELTHIDN